MVGLIKVDVIWFDVMWLPAPDALAVSARALMTFPRVNRDLLMLAPSFSTAPVAPVLSARSDPASEKKRLILTKQNIAQYNAQGVVLLVGWR